MLSYLKILLVVFTLIAFIGDKKKQKKLKKGIKILKEKIDFFISLKIIQVAYFSSLALVIITVLPLSLSVFLNKTAQGQIYLGFSLFILTNSFAVAYSFKMYSVMQIRNLSLKK